MILNMFDFLLTKANKHSVYVHNLSGFDGVFLMDTLASLKIKSSLDLLLNKIGSYDISLIMKEDKIITITLKKLITHKSGHNIFNSVSIKDSLLLLPSSLDKLGQAFGVGGKSNFNYDLLNKSINNITDEEIFAILKYNMSDCVLLYNIINEFQNLIFNLFGLDIHKYPTLSSLAFNIYRKNFMHTENIPITSYLFYNQIKGAYSGGHVDLYRPYGKNLYCYDINSLYPTVMRDNKYPVGPSLYFKGSKNLNEIFVAWPVL